MTTATKPKLCEKCQKRKALRYTVRGRWRPRGGGEETRGYPRVKAVRDQLIVDLRGQDEVVQERFCLQCRRDLLREMNENDFLEDAPKRSYIDDRSEDGEPCLVMDTRDWT